MSSDDIPLPGRASSVIRSRTFGRVDMPTFIPPPIPPAPPTFSPISSNVSDVTRTRSETRDLSVLSALTFVRMQLPVSISEQLANQGPNTSFSFRK